MIVSPIKRFSWMSSLRRCRLAYRLGPLQQGTRLDDAGCVHLHSCNDGGESQRLGRRCVQLSVWLVKFITHKAPIWGICFSSFSNPWKQIEVFQKLWNSCTSFGKQNDANPHGDPLKDNGIHHSGKKHEETRLAEMTFSWRTCQTNIAGWTSSSCRYPCCNRNTCDHITSPLEWWNLFMIWGWERSWND